MVAASIWSLLIPAIEQSSELGKFSFVPAAVGFWIGVLLSLIHIYGVVANLSIVAFAIFNGLAQGAQPLISESYGKGQPTQVRKLLKWRDVYKRQIL